MPAQTLDKDKLINSDDELFWARVRAAYHQVSANNGLAITVEVATKRASVQRNITDSKTILIYLTEVEPAPPILISPG